MSNVLKGVAALVAGAFSLLIPGFGPALASFFFSTGVSFLLAPKAVESDDITESPAYGFRQFQNAAKGDTTIPVVYANDEAAENPGHMVAPTYVQAFATPSGYDDDPARAISTKGQTLSVLLAIAEGPIEAIEDIRLNGEPIFDVLTNQDIGTGNGSKTTFNIPGRRIDVRSVRVYVNGTLKGWSPSTRTEFVAIGDGVRTVWTVKLTADGVEIDDAREIEWLLGYASLTNAARGVTTLTESDLPYPIVWTDDNRRTLYVNTQIPLSVGQRLDAVIPTRVLDGFKILKDKDNKGLDIKFATAPSSGAKITASWHRKNFSNLRVETRLGSAHQLAIEGFEQVKNTVSKNTTLGYQTGVTAATSEPVDDVLVTVAAPQGMRAIDNKGEGESPVSADVRIEWKHTSEGDNKYRALKDPAGTKSGKNLQEFRLTAESNTLVVWQFSVRQLLKRWVENNPEDTQAADDLAGFTRDRYTVKVTRTNKVQQSTNTLISDAIELASITQVLDERLTHVGTAMIGIHAIASDKLQGSLPNVTCRVRGKRDVEYYTGSAWVKSATAQSNPVWASIDLITNKRYGGGEQFTKAANIDLVTAVAAAAWCDENVTHDGTTEKRCVIDYVVDTRRPLMDHVRDMLAPAMVVPVLQGNVWRFIVDRAVDLSTVETIYDDGSTAHVLAGSMTFQHAPVATQITELQVAYLDREDDWERADIWVAPQVPATNRRIERATAFGVTRVSQATRYATTLYGRQTNQGMAGGWSMTPAGLPIEAGDVKRVISTRLGIDLYVRVTGWELESTESMVVKVQAEQYVPAVYGQDAAKQTIVRRPQRPTPTQAPAVKAATVTKPGTNNPTKRAPIGVRATRAA